MFSEEHRVTRKSYNKIVPLLIVLLSWIFCAAEVSTLSVQQVLCQEDNSERKETQINESPNELSSRLTCAVEAALTKARFFAYNTRTKLCQTSFSSSFTNSLENKWIMYTCTKHTAPTTQTGDQKLAEDVNDYFTKRKSKSFEKSKPVTTKSHHNNNNNNDNNVRRPVKVRRPSDISRGRTTKIQTSDLSQTVDTKSENNRNVPHPSKKASWKFNNLKKKVKRKPSRIVPRIRGATLVVVSTVGYIAYINTDRKRIVFVRNLKWQGVLTVHYFTKTDYLMKLTEELLTTLCLTTGKETSKPRDPRVLRNRFDGVNNVNVYLTAKQISIHRGNKRRVLPVIRPLDLQIIPAKGYVYCSCQRSNAVIIMSIPYWENRTDIIRTPVKSLNHFEINPFKSRLFLCGSYGLLMMDPRLPKESTRLVPGRCLHFTRARHMMFAIMTRLSTTFIAQVDMMERKRQDIRLDKLPKQVGKFIIKVLPPGHRVR